MRRFLGFFDFRFDCLADRRTAQDNVFRMNKRRTVFSFEETVGCSGLVGSMNTRILERNIAWKLCDCYLSRFSLTFSLLLWADLICRLRFFAFLFLVVRL